MVLDVGWAWLVETEEEAEVDVCKLEVGVTTEV